MHLVQHQGEPMLLQVLLYSKQQRMRSASAAGADVVDLASQDEQQQLMDDDADLLVVKLVEPRWPRRGLQQWGRRWQQG